MVNPYQPSSQLEDEGQGSESARRFSWLTPRRPGRAVCWWLLCTGLFSVLSKPVPPGNPPLSSTMLGIVIHSLWFVVPAIAFYCNLEYFRRLLMLYCWFMMILAGFLFLMGVISLFANFTVGNTTLVQWQWLGFSARSAEAMIVCGLLIWFWYSYPVRVLWGRRCNGQRLLGLAAEARQRLERRIDGAENLENQA